MYWIPPEWSKELRLDPAIHRVDTGVDCRHRNWDAAGGGGCFCEVDNHCQTTTHAFGADHSQP